MLRRRPALRFTLLLAGGILLAEACAVPFQWLLAPLAAVFAASLVLYFFTPNHLACSVLIEASVLLLGLTLAIVQDESSKKTRLSPIGEEDTLIVKGTLEDQPALHGKTVRMTMRGRVTSGVRPPDSLQRRFIVLASAKRYEGLAERWTVGQSVGVRGTLSEFPRPRNPGEFDYGKYLTLNEVDGILWLADTLESVSAEGWSLAVWFSVQREWFGKVFDRLHGSRQAGFLRGVVFGDRREIPVELKESFVNTGTIHILAVSGSNVAVIALALYMALGLFRIPKHWIVVTTIFGLLYYMMITGASSSIVRATIMGCVILLGQILERKPDIYNSMSVAAMIVLLLSPSQLLDVGFQLSFAAVLSIVSIYPRLELLIRKIPARFEEIKALDYILKLFAVSLAAQLGTLPFTGYYFERFSVISLAANLIAVPVVGINLVLGCLTLASSLFSMWIAGVYAALNEILVSFLLGFVQAAASVPYAVVETPGFSLTAGVVFYLSLACVLNLDKPAITKAASASLVVVGIVWLCFSSRATRNVLRLTALDVGQGDAILVEFPNKTTMLIDAGPKSPEFDSGERIVAPFLKRNGVRRIDRLVVSHPHSDHIGGMPFLFSAVNVGAMVESDTATASRLHATVRARAADNATWQRARQGMEISPDPAVRVYCLSPASASDPNLNNRSIVLKIVYGQTSVLLTGDAENEAEEHLSGKYGRFLDSDILKAGHHGSATSSSLPFLDSITPNFAIISVGRRNKFGHPSANVVQEMERRGVQVFRTDREGAIIFESDGGVWKKCRWRIQEPHNEQSHSNQKEALGKENRSIL